MVKDFVGNELHVGDTVLDLSERKVCTIVKLYKKEVTTSLQVEQQIADYARYGLKKPVTESDYKYHKRATCVVRILTPESK